MWNSLKSDLYRTFHAKMFYVIVGIIILLYALMLNDSGVQSNSLFASFYRTENTFYEFLHYVPKSGVFVFLQLLFFGLFISDEYNSGYAKNTHPLCHNKVKLIIARYMYSVIVIMLINLIVVLVSFSMQMMNPMTLGKIVWLDYIIYLLVQALFLAAVVSFVMMLCHLTRSRVLVILVSCAYGMMMWYMGLAVLSEWLFGNVEILDYTMYVLSGKLAMNFSWDSYYLPMAVLLGNTLLYNGISYFILKKKDI